MAAEFLRLVPLTRLGGEPYRQEIVATETEREALARRFRLLSLDRFVAEVELVREPAGTILLTAAFEAAFEQECIVTLDPVSGSVAERFQLRYGPLEAEESVPAGDDDPAFEPLAGGAIDVGEAVAQEFSLALPPFPRVADALIERDEPETPDEGPFAALDKFRRERPQ
ncbi:MAG TPA: YceD family protein [Stellaceae bacterium]|nr:YceD family protein [Stellaceae bacterium]